MEVEAEGLHGDCASGAGCWGTKKTLWCQCDRVRGCAAGTATWEGSCWSSAPQSWQHLWQGEATNTHGPGVPKPPASRGGVTDVPAQQHIFPHEMQAPWCLAQHQGLLHSACSLARGQARSEAAELCVCAAQHQPRPWGSPSRSCAGCQRGAGASALLRLSNATCWGRETSGTRSRNPGSREHGQERGCGRWEHRVAPASQQDLAPILLRMPCRGGALPALPLPAL